MLFAKSIIIACGSERVKAIAGKLGYYLGIILIASQLASMTQADAFPTGNPKVTDWIPVGSGKNLSWRLIIK